MKTLFLRQIKVFLLNGERGVRAGLTKIFGMLYCNTAYCRWVFFMSQAITTSIRLPYQVRKRLERVSHRFNKGKNGIILDALKDYFQKIEAASFKEEAKRQSLLASRKDREEASIWEDNLDIEDWKS